MAVLKKIVLAGGRLRRLQRIIKSSRSLPRFRRLAPGTTYVHSQSHSLMSVGVSTSAVLSTAKLTVVKRLNTC